MKLQLKLKKLLIICYYVQKYYINAILALLKRLQAEESIEEEEKLLTFLEKQIV